MIVNLLTEHHLKFLSLKEGCRGSPESTLKCQIVGNLMPLLKYHFHLAVGQSVCSHDFLNFITLLDNKIENGSIRLFHGKGISRKLM